MKSSQLSIYRDHVRVSNLQVEQTESAFERMKGLLGREPLGAAQGLWINPCNSVHCGFMKYSIDVLYLNARGAVVKAVRDMAPWSISGCWRAVSVIELMAGEIERLGIEVGDSVKLTARA